MEIKILGSSGTMPVMGRPLSSALLHVNKHYVLLDCGEGTQLQLQYVRSKISKIDIICLTHLHPDHILGLPCLLSTMSNQHRTKDLLIIGPAGVSECVYHMLAPLSPLLFQIQFFELEGKDTIIDFDDFTICAFKVSHSVTCYGYKFTQVYLPTFNVETIQSNNYPSIFWKLLHMGANIKVDDQLVNSNTFFGENRFVRSVVYCVDTRPCSILYNKCKDADVLILEAMYLDNDFVSAKKRKHMLYTEALAIFKNSNAKYLIVTHFSPSVHLKDSQHINSETVFSAESGMQIDIGKEVNVIRK